MTDYTHLTLPERTRKSRQFGITSISDVGLTLDETRSMLEDFADYIDIAKLGVGSAYITPRLQEKIDLYKSFDVDVYFGGTLFEKFYYQNKLDTYQSWMEELGVTLVEVSAGTLSIGLEERVALVNRLKSSFKVLSEVGSKDTDLIMAPSKWIEEISSLLDAGSAYVITEGRNSGTAGVFRPSGEIRTGLVDDIIHTTDPK